MNHHSQDDFISKKRLCFIHTYVFMSLVILIHPFSSVLNFHLFVAFEIIFIEMKSEIS